MIGHQNDKQRRFLWLFMAGWWWRGGMTRELSDVRGKLLCEAWAGTPFEGEFGAFDDGQVVGVEAPVCRGAGHLTIAYFDQALEPVSAWRPSTISRLARRFSSISWRWLWAARFQIGLTSRSSRRTWRHEYDGRGSQYGDIGGPRDGQSLGTQWHCCVSSEAQSGVQPVEWNDSLRFCRCRLVGDALLMCFI